jgi:hypothetical protein
VGGGWVGETKIKAKLSPAKAGAWAELGNIHRCSDESEYLRYTCVVVQP